MMNGRRLHAPFPWFGGKRDIADVVWQRFGRVTQYIEPFCGGAAVLLSAPSPAQLEVVNDVNGFLANFWRAVKYQPDAVAREADYPVSHIDLGARHRWLMAQRESVGTQLHDAAWPGDARVAGWWLWGQCCWIGSGWCEWDGQIPHTSSAGMGVQALGKIPHTGDAGRGVQALGKIPHTGDAGRGVQALGKIPHTSDAGMGLLTSSGRTAWTWLHALADRLERVRITHGDWTRCLNSHYGGHSTAVFLDPPYRGCEAVYGTQMATAPVADEVAAWAVDHADLRIALCGLVGDYDLPTWECVPWTRKRLTYGGNETTGAEALWFSPACLAARQADLFGALHAGMDDGERCKEE